MVKTATAVATERTGFLYVPPEKRMNSMFHHGTPVRIHGDDPQDANRVLISFPGVDVRSFSKDNVRESLST